LDLSEERVDLKSDEKKNWAQSGTTILTIKAKSGGPADAGEKGAI